MFIPCFFSAPYVMPVKGLLRYVNKNKSSWKSAIVLVEFLILLPSLTAMPVQGKVPPTCSVPGALPSRAGQSQQSSLWVGHCTCYKGCL